MKQINLHWNDLNQRPSVWVSKFSPSWDNTGSRNTLYQYYYYILKEHPRVVGHRQLNCYRFWLGYNCILVLRTHPVPTLAPNVTDVTSTEGIRTIDPHFECPSTLPTELIVLYTHAIDSLHQSVVDHGGQTLLGCSDLGQPFRPRQK